MAALASFVGPGGGDGLTAVRAELHALITVTEGDLQFAGQFCWSKIKTRTMRGVDVNGAPFAPYSTKGPYYFYPNAGAAGNVRGRLAPSNEIIRGEVQRARRVAAADRHKALARRGGAARAGTKTPYGIKYDSYADAKAAHGVAVVNLFGMEQHTHMLNTAMIRVGGSMLPATEVLDFGSDLAPFENGATAALNPELFIGFYGPEAERAKGHNEGIPGRLPQREFFALNPDELNQCAAAIGARLQARADQIANKKTTAGDAAAYIEKLIYG